MQRPGLPHKMEILQQLAPRRKSLLSHSRSSLGKILDMVFFGSRLPAIRLTYKRRSPASGNIYLCQSASSTINQKACLLIPAG